MGLQSISPAALQERMRIGPVRLVDVNSPQSWRTARVPGAVNLDPAAYRADDLAADRDAFVVFYCSNFMCRKAPNAARRARGMGFGNVHVMSAGIRGWIDGGLPTESGE